MTKVPQREPRTRNVLVAPAFPLPYSRMSIPKKYRLTHTAVGTEPIRYARKMSRTSFIRVCWLSRITNIMKKASEPLALNYLIWTFFHFETDPTAPVHPGGYGQT